MIDSHAHIYAEQFQEDLPEVIERARKAGVEQILMPNIDRESMAEMDRVASDYGPYCLSMMGLHPCSVKGDYEEQLELVESELRTGKYIAVGEIGTDLYWDKSFWQQQQDAFIRQVRWAGEMDLPVVIHCRESIDETIAMLEKEKSGVSGVFHCFTGSTDQAHRIIELGFYLGIGGVLTFKNGGMPPVVKDLPLDRLLLETDSPYLSPAPFRGKRNEPAHLSLVCGKLAEILELSVEEVRSVTMENTRKLFRLS